jgi:hypothetical protein
VAEKTGDMEGDEVGNLPSGPTEIDRVISQEDAHLYRTRACVAILQSPTRNYSSTDAHWDNPVPVRSYNGKVLLGWATLSLEGTRVIGDFALDYQTQERFEIQSYKNLFPIPRGYMELAGPESIQGDLDFFGTPEVVTEVIILEIYIGSKNSDPRIAPFGEPVL